MGAKVMLIGQMAKIVLIFSGLKVNDLALSGGFLNPCVYQIKVVTLQTFGMCTRVKNKEDDDDNL